MAALLQLRLHRGNPLIDWPLLRDCLGELGLEDWLASIEPVAKHRLSDDGHGDFAKWADMFTALQGVNSGNSDELKTHLLGLSPWRKGPFQVNDVYIDAEWRSDLKWQRVHDSIESLQGRKVLDVGCGNGYYALQMREAGAEAVIGIDPTLLFVVQFYAVNYFLASSNVHVLPLRLQELPLPAKSFDSTFSMGVLYHQRAPIDHLRALRQTLRAGGQLVLETITIPGEESYACTPAERYARMRNVWLLPTLSELATWLKRSGYVDIQFLDTSITTVEEQRSTEWMAFESLHEALQPDDPSKTIEGWPAPRRSIVTATSP